jgi:hypothetical protein
MSRQPEINDHYRRGVVDRMRRYRLMEKSAEHTDAIINLHAEVYQDTDLPVEIRMDAGRWLMDRAYGKAFQALDVTQLIQEQSLQKIIHEVAGCHLIQTTTRMLLNLSPD